MFLDVFFNFFNSFKGSEHVLSTNEHLTLTPVERQSNLTEEQRKLYATELIDTYRGFGMAYLRSKIKNSFNTPLTRKPMMDLAVNLPLLKKFIDSISRVYYTQPHRRFFKNDKEIVDKMPDELKDEEKYIENPKLYKLLKGLYNKNVLLSLKEAERFSNLLQTVIYKINTTEDGSINLVFIPNDSVQIKEDFEDITCVNKIAFIKQQSNELKLQNDELIKEIWGIDKRIIPELKENNKFAFELKENAAGKEAQKLFGSNNIGYAFAPFIVFRNSKANTSFWDIKEADTFDYISSINMSFTELRYLQRYTSFGQKYVVNVKDPKNKIFDPIGLISFVVEDDGVPGNDEKKWEIGEFPNNGRIKDVIESVIFSLKMIYNMYNINLDSLISTNSVRSADSKDKDKDELFDSINDQREIWNLNEQNLFKVMQAVHNRDNNKKIPKGIELVLDYKKLKSKDKTNQDWVLEIQNNVSSILDWILDIYPDLDKNELMDKFVRNKEINIQNEDEEEEGEKEADNIMKVKQNIDNQKDKPKSEVKDV